MLIWLLKKTFGALIGKVPADQQAVFWARANTIITDLVKAAAAGAVAGAINANKK